MAYEGYCFTNYTGNTTPYVVSNNTIEVVEILTNINQKIFTWFARNQMKTNLGKCHLILSTQEEANIQIANTNTESSRSQKLLWIVIDNKLKSELHTGNICQQENRKLNATARLTNYMELPKRCILMIAFLNLSLTITLLFHCFTLVRWLIKLIDSTNVVWESFTTINVQIFKNN